MASIDDLKNTLGMGARKYKFSITIGSSAFNYDGTLTDLLCKGTKIPSSEISVVEVPVKGRKLKIRGMKKYDDTIDFTFFNDEVHSMRQAFEIWLDATDNANTDTSAGSHDQYFADVYIHQLDGANNVVASWQLYNAWPSKVGEVELDGEEDTSITTFPVTFVYSHSSRVA